MLNADLRIMCLGRKGICIWGESYKGFQRYSSCTSVLCWVCGCLFIILQTVHRLYTNLGYDIVLKKRKEKKRKGVASWKAVSNLEVSGCHSNGPPVFWTHGWG